MSKTVVASKENKDLGIPPDTFKKAIKVFECRQAFEIAYRTHDLYHIEDWQKVIFIPGVTKLLRVDYLYDQTERKGFMKLHNGKVELIDGEERIKKINQAIKHPIKAMRDGVFVRKLRFSPFSRIFDLLLIMNGHEELVLGQPIRGVIDKKRYANNKKDYIEMAFDLVIGEK